MLVSFTHLHEFIKDLCYKPKETFEITWLIGSLERINGFKTQYQQNFTVSWMINRFSDMHNKNLIEYL